MQNAFDKSSRCSGNSHRVRDLNLSSCSMTLFGLPNEERVNFIDQLLRQALLMSLNQLDSVRVLTVGIDADCTPDSRIQCPSRSAEDNTGQRMAGKNVCD